MASTTSVLAPKRALIWKEARQLSPILPVLLVFLTIVAALVLQALLAYRSSSVELNDNYLHYAVVLLLGVPAVYSLGTGALLVGHEYEQRTMSWLSGLPIASHEKSGAKLKVSLLGWVAVWVLCSLFIGAILMVRKRLTDQPFGLIEINDPRDLLIVLLIVVQTLYMMFVGIGAAWSCKSTQAWLVAAVVLSILPLAAMALLYWVFMDGSLKENLAVRPAEMGLVISGIAGYLAWRWAEHQGRKELMPQPTDVEVISPSKRFARMFTKDRRPFLSREVPSRAQALRYQVYGQHRVLYLVSAATLGVAVFLLISYFCFSGKSQDEWWLLVGYGLALTSSALVGLSVFQPDADSNSPQFLVEQGVSPAQVWRSRQVLGVGLTVIVCLLLVQIGINAFIETRSYHADPDVRQMSDYARGIQFLRFIDIGLGGFFLAYALGQWYSQCLKNGWLVIASSPIILVATAGLMFIGIAVLDLSGLVITVFGILLLLGTRIQVRNWIDGRMGWRYLTLHFVFPVLFLMGCGAVALYNVYSTPTMSDEVRGALDQAAKSLSSEEFVELKWPDVTIEPATHHAALFPRDVGRDPHLESYAALEQLLNSQQGALRSAIVEFKKLLGHAEAARQSYSKERNDAEAKEHYGRTIDLFYRLTERVRQSRWLIDQYAADMLEIELLTELRRPEAQELLGPERFAAIAGYLADNDGRNQARRHAIAYEWGMSALTRRQAYQRRSVMEFVTERIDLKLLETEWLLANVEQAQAESLRQEHYNNVLANSAYWLKRYGTRSIVPPRSSLPDDVDQIKQTPADSWDYYYYPTGLAWRAGWETQAKELVKVNETRSSH